jgi:hypothetical protein
LTPGSEIQNGKKSGSGINIPDNFSESLETVFFVLKCLSFLIRIRDPGSGQLWIRDRKIGSRILNTAVNTILCAVEEGRQQFHREMASIMPDVKLGEKNSRLTEDELNMFITHAYRKVSPAFAFRGFLFLHFFSFQQCSGSMKFWGGSGSADPCL